MKILREQTVHNVHVLKENAKKGKGKNYYIEGIFLQADVQNRNRRIYPLQTVKSAVKKYDQQYIKTGRALGELGHPENSGINLHLASHKIQKLQADNKNFIGRAKIIDTPMGKIAKTLIDEGVRLGVSLRGFGDTEEKNGVSYVKENFQLTTVDIVADPSMPDAFVNGIMESCQYYCQSGELLQEDYDYVQKSISNLTKAKINEGQLLNLFENFMTKLSKI